MTIPLSEFTGNALYLDTMLPYALLRGIDKAAKRLFIRIENGEIIAYTSVLTFDELIYRLLLALIRERYAGSPFDRLRENEERMIAEFFPVIAPQVRDLSRLSHLTLLNVTAEDLDVMCKAMEQYHLRPRDALHFAAMRKANCFDLASNDQDFDRIPQVRRFTP